MGFKSRKVKTTFQKVKALLKERIEQALDSGKTIQPGSWGSRFDGAVCAVGALALNGNPIKREGLTYQDAYALTAPLLIKCGVPSDKAGLVIDAISAGFEGEASGRCHAYSPETRFSNPDYDNRWTIPTKYMKYYRLGVAARKKHYV